MVSIILLLIMNLNKYSLKGINIRTFYLHFFNMDNSINIAHRLFRSSAIIPDMLMEGTVSHNFNLGPSSHDILCDLENDIYKF